VVDTNDTFTRDVTPHVIPLVAHKEFLVLVGLDTQDLPSRDEITEMRMQARHRRTDTLGTGQAVWQLVDTVALYAASGVVGNAAWSMFPAVGRFLRRRKASARPIVQPDEIPGHARRYYTAALGATPVVLQVTSQAHTPDGAGWIVTGKADSVEFQMIMNADGSVNTFAMQ
jgi:hypothetical protein